MYRTNWGIGHGLKDILEAHKGPFTGQGHKGLYEILTTSWHAQLSLNLAMLGSLTIVVAHHMYSMPPYPYLATDYGTQLSLFTHHMWIGGFLIVGAAAHAAIFMVRDYDPTTRYNDLLDRVLRHRDAIISHLNWACIFLGFHSFGLYIHNDTMSALGRPQDMFSDTAIQLQPVFAQWIQNTHALAPGATAPGATASTSLTWGGGDLVAVGGKVALLPIPLGTADFLVHHIHAFTIHVTVLILLKGVLFARSSRLIPDKANLGFRFPCDGPGRGGTCQVSAWDHVFLGLFWMYNSISVVIFHFSWKMQSDVWGSVSDQGVVTHITGGNFAQSSITINGWLRDFLWAQASQDPLHVRPIAHAIWDPHFGQPAVEAFTRGGALGPVNIAYSGVYQWCLFLGFHTLGLYVHNDVMLAFGTPEKQILIEPIFAQWIQSAHGKTSYGFDVLLSSTTGPAFNAGRSIWLPGWLNAVNENSNSLFLTIGPGDFLVHHAIALGLHTTTLILVKGALDARGSKLMPDKKDFGYSFPCDGPGRGGTSHYGKELIETLAWAHERTPLANLIRWRDKPVALSIVQARLVGLAHFSEFNHYGKEKFDSEGEEEAKIGTEISFDSSILKKRNKQGSVVE
ncbi:hypothetical protein RDI58_031276 [Solanum bulbocastanum]|uniref:photosystem I n=1 Tax=Solanum bulbocastanum TaxID=147425 RepID=A0AAN8SNA5_SOLBU